MWVNRHDDKPWVWSCGEDGGIWRKGGEEVKAREGLYLNVVCPFSFRCSQDNDTCGRCRETANEGA